MRSLFIKYIPAIIFLLAFFNAKAQSTAAFADSIRMRYHIPELAYAVVSSTEVLELKVTGVKRINTTIAAEPGDRFRIGSNTKAITGFIAAQLVRQHKIGWNTKFFDLFPELKAQSNPVYYQLTLQDLLTFRTKLFSYTYTYAEPKAGQFTGDEAEQRYQFTTWFFRHEPVKGKDSINFSNLGYIAAGQMLERVSGKSYKELVNELGLQLGISFGFGAPNATDSAQPWGHDGQLHTEAPAYNYKLDWLLPAGNINVGLPDYAKFIQLQLKGLAGQSELLSQEDFDFLHFGAIRFSVGWFWQMDSKGQRYSWNIGNPGTFLSKVYVFKDRDRAYILLANAQTDETDTGLDILYEELKRKYSR